MEEPLKNKQSSLSSGKSILRYPLRSATKSKDQTNKSPQFFINSSISTLKRGRTSIMSKSVSVLELSDKEKSAKPPKRLSIPAKSGATPRHKSTSNAITPISEARTKRLANGHERCETPLSDVSRSSIRRKFNILASASYWLSQIKLSESSAKHSISLGFFKLAIEAGTEPMQRLREELKSYAQRHNLAEFGETVRGLFETYEISETLEQLQESVICSNVPEDETTLSSEDVQSTSSTAATKKLKPKSLNIDTQASLAKASSKKGNVQKITLVTKIRASVSSDHVKPKITTESRGNNVKKPDQYSNKMEKPKRYDKTVAEEVMAKSMDRKEALEGNKENMNGSRVGEEILAEETKANCRTKNFKFTN